MNFPFFIFGIFCAIIMTLDLKNIGKERQPKTAKNYTTDILFWICIALIGWIIP